MEIWKPVIGYENSYEVSNFGRVKSLDRIIIRPDGTSFHKKEKILSTKSFGHYVQAILCKEGKIRCFSVHRLVAQAFIPNPDNLPCVNHKDENPENNNVDNLEWCTYQYNNSYNGRIDKCKDKIRNTLLSKNYHHKMTAEQIEHIREGAKKGWETRRKHIKKKEQEEV